VRLLRRGKRPLYRLTRTGLIELISRAVNSSTTAPGQFFFLHYFMSSYRPKIIELVKSEGKQFPYALEVELQGLLNCSELLDREIKNAERTLKELDERIIEGQKASQLTAEAIVKKVPHDEIVRKWEEQYPYALNSHKPLSELFREISPDIARWELETGNTRRVENIWKPARAMHLRYLETLRKLKSEQS
jgi:hypothetical protein